MPQSVSGYRFIAATPEKAASQVRIHDQSFPKKRFCLKLPASIQKSGRGKMGYRHYYRKMNGVMDIQSTAIFPIIQHHFANTAAKTSDYCFNPIPRPSLKD
jgi:hypothetical protein